MATNQPAQRGGSQTQQQGQQGQPGQQGQQSRSIARQGAYFPNLSGDLFSLSPFALLREMTDLMDRSYSGPAASAPAGQSARRGLGVWAPALEVREKDNNLVVCADLPGIDPNDVKIEIENDMLVIQGERKREHQEEREGWHHSERSYGSFYRTIALPEGAKTENAKADFHNGVLEVTVPIEQPKSNRRQIQIESSGARTSGSVTSGAGKTTTATSQSGAGTTGAASQK